MKLSVLAAFLTLAALPAYAESVRVVDGDTLKIDGVTYRLWGIDAPRRANCALTKRREVFQSAQKCFLYDVLGHSRVADQPARQLIGGIEVRKHDPLEIVDAFSLFHRRLWLIRTATRPN